jgi:hypothetical protein
MIIIAETPTQGVQLSTNLIYRDPFESPFSLLRSISSERKSHA